jgi:hypothetical protein
MSDEKKELSIFSVSELQAAVQNVEGGVLPSDTGVLILDFYDTLYTDNFEGAKYLIGGQKTVAMLDKLDQSGVRLCLAMSGTQHTVKAAHALLIKDDIAKYFDFIVYSYQTDRKKTLLSACKEAYAPKETNKPSPKKDSKKQEVVFAYIDHVKLYMDTANELEMRVIRVAVSSKKKRSENAKELNLALVAVQKQFKAYSVSAYDTTVLSDDEDDDDEGEEKSFWLSSAWSTFLETLGDPVVDPLTPLVEQAKSVPVSASQWLKRNFFYPPLLKDWSFRGFKSALLNAYLVTYGFDGYDSTTGEIVYADDTFIAEDKRYYGDEISSWLLFAAFLGLPTRPAAIPDYADNVAPELPKGQLLKNLVGGIDWNEKTSVAKKWIQGLGAPIKLFVIAPLKLVTLPFKFLINVTKLFTEFLPWVGAIISFGLLLISIFLSKNLYYAMLTIYNFGLNHRKREWWLFGIGRYVLSKIGALISLILLVVVSVLMVLIAVSHLLSRIILVVGRATTSPEKSLRMAYANGKALTIAEFGPTAESIISYAMGGLVAALSIAVSIFSWAIVFPLLMGAIVSAFPPIMQALTWVLQWPAINASLGFAKGILVAAKPFFSTIFGPTLKGISSFLGVRITTFGIVGAIMAPVAILITMITDKLSNQWASWHEGSFFGGQEENPGPKPRDDEAMELVETEALDSPILGQNNYQPATEKKAEAVKETPIVDGFFKSKKSSSHTPPTDVVSRRIQGVVDRAEQSYVHSEGSDKSAIYLAQQLAQSDDVWLPPMKKKAQGDFKPSIPTGHWGDLEDTDQGNDCN